MKKNILTKISIILLVVATVFLNMVVSARVYAEEPIFNLIHALNDDLDRVYQLSEDQTVLIPLRSVGDDLIQQIYVESMSGNLHNVQRYFLGEWFNDTELKFLGFEMPADDGSVNTCYEDVDVQWEENDNGYISYNINFPTYCDVTSADFLYLKYLIPANTPIGRYMFDMDLGVRYGFYEFSVDEWVDRDASMSAATDFFVRPTAEPQVELLDGPYVYTGNKIEPKVAVSVLSNGKKVLLQEGQDYVLVYGQNIEVGPESGSITIAPSLGYGYFDRFTIHFPVIEAEQDSDTPGSSDDEVEVYIDESTKVISFRIKKDFSFFQNGGKVYVDNNLLSLDEYEAQEGSTIITLNSEFASTLSDGDHLLTVAFNDGSEVSSSFVVAFDSSDASDSSNSLVVPDTGFLTREFIGGALETISVFGVMSLIVGFSLLYIKKKH